MIHRQAQRLTAMMISRNIVDAQSHEIYTYGFELFISATINILIMAIISVAFRCYYHWFLFLIAFIPLRMTAGGYHANSHMKCIIIGTATFTGLLMLYRLKLIMPIIIPAIAGISFLAIIFFSPVEAHNKKLTKEQRTRNRKVSICIATMNIFFAMTAVFIQRFAEIIAIYYTGVFSAALSMLVVKVQKTERGRRHENHEELVS